MAGLPPGAESLAELVRFAPDAYGFRYQNYVALFVVTDEGVILVDPIGQGNPRTPSMIKDGRIVGAATIIGIQHALLLRGSGRGA